jgi:hypothetical protein
VLFSLRTPVYSIRQLHDVEMSNFRPRNSVAAVPAVPQSGTAAR